MGSSSLTFGVKNYQNIWVATTIREGVSRLPPSSSAVMDFFSFLASNAYPAAAWAKTCPAGQTAIPRADGKQKKIGWELVV